VVLAEDDPDARRLLARGLTRRGWSVEAVATGAEALRAAGAGAPDVVVLDWTMPEMTGGEVCAALRADPSTAGIPVVLLTGRSHPDEVDAGLAAGAAAHVTKPVSLDELERLLSRLVAASGRRDGSGG
jgi:CheY-like chemotaxis protein